MRFLDFATALSAVLALHTTIAIKLDVNSPDSIKSAAKTIATRMIEKYYYGGEPPHYLSGVPGLLPQAPVKYYWWETGSMLLTLIDYFYYTNDSSFNSLVAEGILFQIGPNHDFVVQNQSSSMGNDDQCYWALAAMAAAETKFPNPPVDQPSWLALAQAVFNQQVGRWDTTHCNGGLRWQAYPWNAGWDYKNSASNMGLFLLAARLGAYTHNQTYTDWATKLFDWQAAIGLINGKGEVFDGSDDLINCTEINHIKWSYTSSMALYGSAVMYSVTNNSIWLDRVNTIWTDASTTFFKGQIMTEQACELNNPVNCNVDQQSFKATFARFVASATKYVPGLYDKFQPFLAASANAAAAQCTGGPQGDLCGTIWFNNGAWDSSDGVGQQMSALSVIDSNLINSAPNLVTNTTGGISVGDPNAGSGSSGPITELQPVTTADRAGAGILTAIVLSGTIGLVWFACN